uniref:Uncharacterized protein n=1 Tax=viral metagenome TaxID=1070528 RepID=A0A6H1ZPZ1_9ZZZZ
MNILGSIFQVKISFLGWKGNAQVVWGKPTATLKLIEVSVALFTVGVRITVRV